MMEMMNFGYGGDWNDVPSYMQQMMQNYYGGLGPFVGLFGLMRLVTWILVVILLISLIRWVWRKGNK